MANRRSGRNAASFRTAPVADPYAPIPPWPDRSLASQERQWRETLRLFADALASGRGGPKVVDALGSICMFLHGVGIAWQAAIDAWEEQHDLATLGVPLLEAGL